MQQRTSGDLRVADLWTVLRGRWRVVATALLLALAVGAALAVTWPAAYSATAVVTVNPITTSPFSATPVNQQVNITTERAIVQSSEVAQLASAGAGRDLEPAEIVDALRVSSPLNSQVLEITATLDDPDAAARTANAVAQAYLDFRAEGADAVALRLSENLDRRIAELAEQLSDDPAQAALPSQLAIQEQIAALRQQQSEFAVIAINPGRIITTASAPAQSRGPGVLLFVGPALVLGLMAGVLLALLRERTDGKARGGRHLADLTGLPVLHEDRSRSMTELTRRAVLRLGLSTEVTSRPVLVGVLGVDRRSAAVLTPALSDALRRCGHCVRTVDVADAAPDGAVERGWPQPADLVGWSDTDVVLVAMAGGEGPAQAAMLAQRLDETVVVALPTSPRRAVTTLLGDLEEAGTVPNLLVLLPRGAGSGQPSGRAAEPAPEREPAVRASR